MPYRADGLRFNILLSWKNSLATKGHKSMQKHFQMPYTMALKEVQVTLRIIQACKLRMSPQSYLCLLRATPDKRRTTWSTRMATYANAHHLWEELAFMPQRLSQRVRMLIWYIPYMLMAQRGHHEANLGPTYIYHTPSTLMASEP